MCNTGSKHCNTLQHTATHCNRCSKQRTGRYSMLFTRVLAHVWRNTLQPLTTHCNTLQHTAIYTASYSIICAIQVVSKKPVGIPYYSHVYWHILYITHCNTLQHTATHCNMCNTGNTQGTGCSILLRRILMYFTKHSATNCNTLHHYAAQHTATNCDTLQHTAAHCNMCNTGNTQETGCSIWLKGILTCVLHSTLQQTATYVLHSTLQQTATHCNTLQHCLLQHTATHCNMCNTGNKQGTRRY